MTLTDIEGCEQLGVLFESAADTADARASEILEALSRGPDSRTVLFRNVWADVHSNSDEPAPTT